MDYHCNSKFNSLQVHVQGRLLYNCHKAFPERVDVKWLESNPGRLFHTKTMMDHRNLMLQNKACSSCYYGCYKYEEQGLPSTRLLEKDGTRKITDPENQMETLQIMLSTDCNLACIYCSPEHSSSWQREISKDGEYQIGERKIKNDKFSLLWAKMKQKERSTESKFFALLLNEIILAKGLKKIVVLGGEPLLSNQLGKLTQTLQNHNKNELELVTGLGISKDRLKKFLLKTKSMKIRFSISAEATNDFFAFIRYGTDWSSIKDKIDIIKSHNQEVRFISTISNISLFDFHNFHNDVLDKGSIKINQLGGNPHLSPHVMDEVSKEKCKENIRKINDPQLCKTLEDMLSKKPNDNERKVLGSYLRQLATRRKLSLDFLPAHFLKWCEAIG